MTRRRYARFCRSSTKIVISPDSCAPTPAELAFVPLWGIPAASYAVVWFGPMSQWLKGLVAGAALGGAVALVAAGTGWGVARPAAAQFTRLADGKPNLNGVWQAINTANWDIEAHNADAGPHNAIMGAASASRRAWASSTAARSRTNPTR